MRYAGLEPADNLVGATLNPTFACTTTMLDAETLASRGGAAARHGARLILSTAMFLAIWRSTTVCVGSAAIKLAHALRTMLAADIPCLRKSGAAFRLAYFPAAVTAVPPAVSFFGRCGSCNAIAE